MTMGLLRDCFGDIFCATSELGTTGDAAAASRGADSDAVFLALEALGLALGALGAADCAAVYRR